LQGRLGRHQSNVAFLFITPTMLLFAIFTLIPIVLSLYFSFTNYDVLSRIEFIGLDNYKRMLDDHVLWVTFKNVFLFSVIYVPLNLGISLSLALLLNRPRRGVGTFRTMYYVPTLTSGVAAATVWLWLLNPEYGLINQLLSYIGITGPAWLATTDTALISVTMVILWQTIGSNMIIYAAGLSGIPNFLYESARLDGAGAFACFRYITLPSLRPTTFFVSTMTIIGALQLFDQPYVLTQGGPANATRTVVYNIYQSGFNELQMGYASAQAFLLAAIILIFAFINMRLNKEGSMI